MLKKTLIFAGTACALLCLLCLVHVGMGARQGQDVTDRYGVETPENVSAAPDETPVQSSSVEEESTEPSGTPYQSPVDFAALKEINGDIYAWLDIPGTDISYPVVQSAADDTYYLDHGSDGASNSDGALFTEHAYNRNDFEDMVTIVYGHHMRSGRMFGSLQALYADAASYQEHSSIVVYLPDREIHYRVFAAVPYDKRHILYNYDFSNARLYQAFFDSIVSIRSLNANVSPDDQPQFDTKVLILSTCLTGDSDGRYLVMAKQVE